MSKVYPRYVPSGSEFIGDIPDNWEAKRLKTLGKFLKGSRISKSDLVQEGEPVVLYGHLYTKYLIKTEKVDFYITELLAKNSRKAFKGDLLLTVTGESEKDIGKCIVYLGDKPTNIGGDLVKFTPHYENGLFLAYSLNSLSSIAQKARSAKGEIVVHISQANLGNIIIPTPALAEQKKIVNFLEIKLRIIDDLISKKIQFIERLKEKRIALISQVVTKGLPSDEAKKHGLPENPASKDSKYRWIGEINSNWTTEPLKRTVKTRITDGPHETPEILDDGVPFVSAEAVENGTINFNKVRGYISQEADENYSKKCKPQRNDLFIVKSGSTTGKIAIVETDENFNIWSPIALVRPKDIYNPRFVFYALNSDYFQNQIRLFWSFGTQPNIGMGVIENLRIVVPTNIKEQQILVSYLDKKTKNLDSLIEKAIEAIERLTEYRSAIITAAVTGKIDVRSINQ